LKLSAAFAPPNAALVLRRADADASDDVAPPRQVFVTRAVAVTGDAAEIEAATSPAALARATGYAEDKIARADLLVRLTMAAVARLRESVGPLEGAGIVVGHGLATIDTNAAYLARIVSAGASRGEPRRFPYTTPNAPAGECAVAFGLTGPAFAVGGGPHGGLEALAVAAELVRAGVADRIVVVAVDEAGPGSRRLAPDTKPGAVALLVTQEVQVDRTKVRRGDWARLEGCTVGLPRELPEAGALVVPRADEAHRALLPLAFDMPEALDVWAPWGGFANARFFWL
jgi:3-oxoacyl-[acyl-carrier-protein] synthase-1/3-oxoacyl-[acyl-carrier-protein] synthase II